MGQVRIAKHKILADALVWLGFECERKENGQYILKRDSKFDRAWKDLHYLRAN
ncbi:hypothetical protein NQ830_12215 [Clostridioides difficile]|uniref:hypothetical protein n=1 Tax=Clostridioides difficile TaxID=1496 RepID=UPI00038D3C75|nr:hypothetical protein [Clostridioides difficile]EQJ88620.1 hypothetical protein QUC_3310 [Clostridioides difficile P50]MCO8835423.1 hypothetical protein [Clostridioides difficile]MCR1410095.1 hypothetical protein [Clostridioides difficile]MCR1421084.1 hypothetical protein [Clostridioides difficile]MDI0326387.1 hypothetical protein [Clostridioides difficile]